ncbi:MAG: DUF3380 domain-containing protein [Sphingobacteriales bacterium]|nr:MAG: DUF3380 domain-containing protein [Sphingobacteriales bacterium]
MGLGQVMGFNHAKLGFTTVEEMWSAFEKGEYEQVVGMTFFIKNTAGLSDALKAKNWAKVAMLYNGSNYAINKYDIKLANAYAKYKKLQDVTGGGAQPSVAGRSTGRSGSASRGFEPADAATVDDDIEVQIESVLSANSFLMSVPIPARGKAAKAKPARKPATSRKAAVPKKDLK